MISGGWMSCWVESADSGCENDKVELDDKRNAKFSSVLCWKPKVSSKKLSEKLKRCHEWSATRLRPWLIAFSSEYSRINHSKSISSIITSERSWSPARSTTVRHSSVSKQRKIETNSIYLRYTNGTRFTSPQTCCKRAQTYINQTHSKAFREKKSSDVYLCKNFSKCRFSFLFRVFFSWRRIIYFH